MTEALLVIDLQNDFCPKGARTHDLLGEEGITPLSTSEMGDAILAALTESV